MEGGGTIDTLPEDVHLTDVPRGLAEHVDDDLPERQAAVCAPVASIGTV